MGLVHWRSHHESACVQVAKHTKSRKTTYATIELFTLKSNAEVINDVLEVPNKGDKVLEIAWEPNGHRFAVIHGELAPGQKQSVSFYTMVDKTMKQGAKLLGTIANRCAASVCPLERLVQSSFLLSAHKHRSSLTLKTAPNSPSRMHGQNKRSGLRLGLF